MMESKMFWDMTLRKLVIICRRFGNIAACSFKAAQEDILGPP
jgi:hypothetical protein